MESNTLHVDDEFVDDNGYDSGNNNAPNEENNNNAPANAPASNVMTIIDDDEGEGDGNNEGIYGDGEENDFFSRLLSDMDREVDKDDYVEVDPEQLSLMLARKIQKEEEALEEERKKELEFQLQRDNSFAKKLHLMENEGMGVIDEEQKKRELEDQKLALLLQHSSDATVLEEPTKKQKLDDLALRDPIVLKELEEEDARLALLLQQQEEDEGFALKLQREIEEEENEQLKKDEALAKALAKEEEQKNAGKEKEDEEEQFNGSEKKDVGTLDEIFQNHLVEFLDIEQLTDLRNFVIGKNVVIRAIRKPNLEERFRKQAAEFESKYGILNSAPILAYHGTNSNVVNKIKDGGLKLPGSRGGKVEKWRII